MTDTKNETRRSVIKQRYLHQLVARFHDAQCKEFGQLSGYNTAILARDVSLAAAGAARFGATDDEVRAAFNAAVSWAAEDRVGANGTRFYHAFNRHYAPCFYTGDGHHQADRRTRAWELCSDWMIQMAERIS